MGTFDGMVARQNAEGRFAAFEEGAPAGLWAAPGRVNLIGEHTDYNAGLCLPIALFHATVVAARPRPDSLLRIASADLGEETVVDLAQVEPGVELGWAGYAAGTLWAMRRDGLAVGGMDVALASDVPVGAGLSSSAAFEGAVAAAADGLFELGLLATTDGRRRLARLCQQAENEIVGAPTGGLDQSASLLSEPGRALLLDFGGAELSTESIPFDLSAAGLELLVVDTRAPHRLVDGQYAARRAQCEHAAAELDVATLRDADLAAVERLSDPILRRRARHVVTEIERVREVIAALRRTDFAAVGAAFDASHASLRDDYEVSCPELDAVCEAALGAGALGARMTGGGFGGSAIALLEARQTEAASAAVTERFAAEGWIAPRSFVVTAGPGARRLR